ncbi:MAG: hypothetical protein ACI82O_004152 [Patiriisocius sp.]
MKAHPAGHFYATPESPYLVKGERSAISAGHINLVNSDLKRPEDTINRPVGFQRSSGGGLPFPPGFYFVVLNLETYGGGHLHWKLPTLSGEE